MIIDIVLIPMELILFETQLQLQQNYETTTANSRLQAPLQNKQPKKKIWAL